MYGTFSAKGHTSKKNIMSTLNMTNIFRCMMEGGYYPIYEKDHIVFGIDDNLAVVEYEEGILSVRIFFSIDEDVYALFLKASNETMMKAYTVKPVVLDDMKNIMFSCEILCDNVREFRKFFPRCITLLNEALKQHKTEMKRLLMANEIVSKTIPATDDRSSVAGNIKSRKILS